MEKEGREKEMEEDEWKLGGKRLGLKGDGGRWKDRNGRKR